jgi:hypothetical protein
VFWRTVGRLILVPIAFLLAALVAAAIVATLGLEHVTRALHGNQSGEDTVASMFDLAQQVSVLASGLSILPALAVVVIGEVARIRSWLYYVVGGGLALACVPLLTRLSQSEALVVPPTTVWQVLATAGFAGGFIYWLLAGRNA